MTSATVVIPSRGGRARLPTLFASLRHQTHPLLEVVLVIDGDIDDTESLAIEWAGRLNLRSINHLVNQGRSAALNTGFNAALGDVLIRCDDDLELSPDHVARHVRHHENGEPQGVIGLCPNLLPDTPFAQVYGRRRDAMFRAAALAMPPEQRWRLWGANVSVTRDMWNVVGGYDTAYRAYGMEDVDWGFRLHQAGFDIVVDPALDATHLGAATTTEIRALRAFHSGAARRTFDMLHGPEVLHSPSQPSSPWGRATVVAGRHLTISGVSRLGRSVDRLATYLPSAVAEKAVAFTVEAAAESGHRHSSDLDLSI